MATLTNLKIKDTYDGLLKLSSNDVLVTQLFSMLSQVTVFKLRTPET